MKIISLPPGYENRAKKIMGLIIRILIIIVICYAAVLLTVLLRQKKMLYFPLKAMSTSPADIGLSYRDVTFKTTDGLTLSGWFVGVERNRDIPAIYDSQNVVLFCHGNGGNISHRLDTLAIFHRLGLRTFIFDYRGYGRSEGDPSEDGTYRDVEAAWRYLTEDESIPPDRIILFGRSLGGAVAAHMASKTDARALVLESTFTSVPNVAAEIYPFLPVHMFCRFKYNTLDRLKRIEMPVLVVHSNEDNMIPFRHGRELFLEAKEPKQFLEIHGSHNQGFHTSEQIYTEGLKQFLDLISKKNRPATPFSRKQEQREKGNFTI